MVVDELAPCLLFDFATCNMPQALFFRTGLVSKWFLFPCFQLRKLNSKDGTSFKESSWVASSGILLNGKSGRKPAAKGGVQ